MSALQFVDLQIEKKTIRFTDGSLMDEWRWLDPDGTPRAVSREVKEFVEPPSDERLRQALFRQEWCEVTSEAYRDDPPEALPAQREAVFDARAGIENEVSKPKRVRYPNLAKVERETGRTVASISVAPDGTRTFVLGQPEAAARKAGAVGEPPRVIVFKSRPVPNEKVVL